MTVPDYDDPQIEERWCGERRMDVLNYLSREGVVPGKVGDWPAWHVAPYVSVWAIESKENPDRIGWWAIAGDLPTDYVSAYTIKDPRSAVTVISERWQDLSGYMLRGEPHPEIQIGQPEAWPQLGSLLRSRASLLARWAKEESLWQDEDF